MTALLRTVMTGGAVLGLTSLLGPVVSLMALRDEEAPDPVLRFWARTILRAADVRHEAHGVENVPTTGRFILVLNHQSHFDTLVVLAHLPHHLRFVGKRELFRIPIFGHAARALGNIEVARDGGEADRQRMKAAIERVRERVNVVFYAEGTRSPDGRLGSFKKGAAVLALAAGVPIVPAALSGTGHILPKGARQVSPGERAVLVVGRPIPTNGRPASDRDALTAQTRAAVEALLGQADALRTASTQ